MSHSSDSRAITDRSATANRRSTARVDERIDPSSEYFRVPISTLTIDRPLAFSIYAPVGGSLVRFLQAGKPLTRANRMTLLASDQQDVYVRESDRAVYGSYLESSIVAILEAECSGIEERITRVCEVGDVVAEGLLTDPSSPRSRAMATEWVGLSARLFDGEAGIFAGMARVFTVDPDIYRDAIHVSLYGLGLARSLGSVHGRELVDFGIGLMLHDIGMLEIPRSIIEKTTSLDERERAIVQGHPRIGYEMVQGLNWVGSIARDVILHHHERPDGKGYPTQIAPRDLSLHARVAAVASAFNALTTLRADRPALTTKGALEAMIGEGRGAYDSKVIATLVRLLST